MWVHSLGSSSSGRKVLVLKILTRRLPAPPITEAIRDWSERKIGWASGLIEHYFASYFSDDAIAKRRRRDMSSARSARSQGGRKPSYSQSHAAAVAKRLAPAERKKFNAATCSRCTAKLGQELPFGPGGASFVAFGSEKVVLLNRSLRPKDKW